MSLTRPQTQQDALPRLQDSAMLAGGRDHRQRKVNLHPVCAARCHCSTSRGQQGRRSGRCGDTLLRSPSHLRQLRCATALGIRVQPTRRVGRLITVRLP